MIHLSDHRRRLLLAGLFALAPLLGPAAGHAWGQGAHGRLIPSSVKTAEGPPPAQVLNDFIQPEVANLLGAVPAAQKQARELLDREAGMVGGGTPSPAYIDAYSGAVNDALLPAAKSPDLRARLNAAIVVAKVAAKTNSIRFAPTATAFTKDPAEPVVLWGIKAAQSIMPSLIQTNAPTAPPLAAAVVKAVGRFPNSGPIAEEAYKALAGEQMSSANAPAAVRSAALPFVLDLMRQRVTLYTQANNAAAFDPALLPAMPDQENVGLVFISVGAWKTATKPTQGQMARVAVDLAAQASDLSDKLSPRTPGEPPEEPRKDDFIALINQVGSAAVVMGESSNNPAIKNAAAMLTSSKVGLNTPKAAIDASRADLESAFKAAGLLAPASPAPSTPVSNTAGK